MTDMFSLFDEEGLPIKKNAGREKETEIRGETYTHDVPSKTNVPSNFDEFMKHVLKAFPNALVDEASNGELTISTGHRLDEDGYTLLPFEDEGR